MQQIIEMAKGFDWSPFWISLKTGIVATVICFFLGLFAARKVLKMGPKARAVVDGILTLPMVMAPTVAGFFLLLLFSLRRPIGETIEIVCLPSARLFVYSAFSVTCVFSFPAVT